MNRALPCSTDYMFQNTELQKIRRTQLKRETEPRTTNWQSPVNLKLVKAHKMNPINKVRAPRKKNPPSDKDCVRVERRSDRSYNVVMTGRLAEKFMAGNRNLEQLIGRNISDIDTFNNLLGDAISNFELNNPLPATESVINSTTYQALSCSKEIVHLGPPLHPK